MLGKNIAVLIKQAERQYEGLRTSLGLLLERHRVTMIVLDHEICMTEAYRDNLVFIDEMDGQRFSNVPKNVSRHGFQPISAPQISAALDEADLVMLL